MKIKVSNILCISIISLILIPYNIYSWGVWGHIHINRAAIFALPDKMKSFYFNHADFITEGAVIPDLRRGILNDRPEPPRHFLDLEAFNKNTLDNLPRSMVQIDKLYDSAFLQKNGILPWYIINLTDKLTASFKKRNKSEILFLSAELGHYIGDAHVPLHTTINYDGQLTNQKGIHSFWESRIPEYLGSSYNFNAGPAKYIDNIPEEIFKIIKESNELVLPLLTTEKDLLINFNKEKLYLKDSSGNVVRSYGQPVFSNEFVKDYNEHLNGMVEMQLRKAISDLAAFWYTAWVNAGKPELSNLDELSITKANRKQFKKQIKKYAQGRLISLKTEKE